MRSFLFLPVIFILFLFLSCKKYQPAFAAFYFKSKNIKIDTKVNEGSGSHKITDLWLYVNGKYQGAFPVGNLMPIPSNGEKVSINIFAGIKNNGISDTRIPYSFYEFVTIDTLIETGITIERDITFEYKASTNYTWTENFESSGYSLVKAPVSEVNFTIAKPEDSFEGKSMQLALNDSTIIAELESSGDGFALPLGSSNVYLELNYKCTEEFDIGLIGDNNYHKLVITLKPTSEWNKIYVQLSSAVSTQPTSSKYKVYFQLLKTNVNSSPKLFLDNLKLIYL
jgi:hypothetical protein